MKKHKPFLFMRRKINLRIRFFYHINENIKLSKGHCNIIEDKEYDKGYIFLTRELTEVTLEVIDYYLEEIKKIKNDEIECCEGYGIIWELYIYKDKVKFEGWTEEDWECSTEEFEKGLRVKKTFLMLPKEFESYVEAKISDL